MNKYEIDVNLVEAAGSITGNTFQVSPMQMEVKLPKPDGSFKNARVIWTFRNLPAGLKPVITFDSPEVIAAGPTTTLGATPQVSFEIKFPRDIRKGLLEYFARYRISLASSSAKKSEPFPTPIQDPCLVVIRTPDPPPGGGGTSVKATSHAEA